MRSDHNINCDCFDCLDAVDTSPIGKFIRSDKVVYLYRKPGGTPARIAQPNMYVGKVAKVNTTKNWLITTEGLWVPYSKDLYFNVAKKLTDKEKDAAKEYVFLDVATRTGGPLIKPAYAVGKGAIETAQSAANTISFIGTNLKWFVLLAISIILLGLFLRLKG